MENIRLVIWDLDRTFWQGTLTEGGIQYSDANHAIVVELAKRGIMSSICSNNDMDKVVPVLEAQGIREYFIFPDISWGPKGPRIAALIESVQLRPETVMFVDDNPMNLAEASFFVPGLRVAPETFIAEMLGDPLFTGKDDRQLTRLKQYKVLETRKADEKAAGSDNRAFLRASDIRVSIDHDVEANIDRAIELINRTNQLNFTKKRLPEDPGLARQELLTALRRYDAYAGLVRVTDRYGDYGYVGFFLLFGNHQQPWAEHFCFSCRTLNMGVETWIYRHLGRPGFVQVGEVLTDVVTDGTPIDWITLNDSTATFDSGENRRLGRLVLRGGCDLSAVSHYLAGMADDMRLELHTARDNRQVRSDHSAFIPFAAGGVSDTEKAALLQLGYDERDWTSALARPATPGHPDAWVLSFWVDSFSMQYRHRVLDLVVPFYCPGDPHATVDVTGLEMDYLERFIETDTQRSAIAALKRDWVACGNSDESMLRARLRGLADKAGPVTPVVILLGPERWTNSATGETVSLAAEANLNAWIRAAVGSHPNFLLLDVLDCIGADQPRDGALHFDRMAYRTIAARIREAILTWPATVTSPEATLASVEAAG